MSERTFECVKMTWRKLFVVRVTTTASVGSLSAKKNLSCKGRWKSLRRTSANWNSKEKERLCNSRRNTRSCRRNIE